MKNFILSCQPLKYDHTSSTLHTVIMWYINSTSFASEDEDENEIINDGEWGGGKSEILQIAFVPIAKNR